MELSKHATSSYHGLLSPFTLACKIVKLSSKYTADKIKRRAATSRLEVKESNPGRFGHSAKAGHFSTMADIMIS
jgi:hypothetical protein